MNRMKLLSTAAAVLMLGTGAALAQAPAPSKDQAPPQPAPAAQQNAPAEKIAPSIKSGTTATPSPDGNDVNKLAPGRGQSAQTGAPKSAADAKTDMKVPSAAAKTETKTETKSSADAANSGTSATATTTGQGAGAAARLSSEQRSQITTVIKRQNVQPVTLNVAIRVGTRIPSTVRYYPLPTEVVTIYPEWRGYDYILVGNQILVLDPRTHEIVAILEA